MEFLPILKALVLLAVANGTPVIATRVLGRRLSMPIDSHRTLADGRPVFGPSKTIRGFLAAVIATTLCAPLVGLDFKIGFVAGLTAMLGDLCSSFIKRRLALPASSRATGLDQVPESLFPLLACRAALALTFVDIAVCSVLFFVGEQVLSRLFFKLKLRDRPY